MTDSKNGHPAWLYVLFPAVAMLLGWGLRGYIGGGPYGAMIPGSFVALSLCLLLGYRMETAAVAAVFGAIGVGYGGNMTYGQTLGFLMETETIYWGVLGCLLKGGVWGLLGGAVLGTGLARDHYDRKTLIAAFLITVPAFLLGVYLINEPKLLYFSNRLDKPRDESWAGLLFAALALLAFLRARGSKKAFEIPLRFALWGLLGGALGFGGGCLWLAFGKYIPVSQKLIGWWKMMEFSFGFIFGAALGWCAWLNRDRLRQAGQEGQTPGATWGPCIGLVAFVILTAAGFLLLRLVLPDGFRDNEGAMAVATRFGIRVFFSFIFFGAITLIFGLHSLHAAWQAAVTLTVYRAVLDYTRDLSSADNFGYVLSGGWQLAIGVTAGAAAGYLAYRFMRGPNAVQREFLLVLWACYIAACARSYGHMDLIVPPEGKSVATFLFQDHVGLFFVHGTFTVSTVLTTWWILTRFSREGQAAAA